MIVTHVFLSRPRKHFDKGVCDAICGSHVFYNRESREVDVYCPTAESYKFWFHADIHQSDLDALNLLVGPFAWLFSGAVRRRSRKIVPSTIKISNRPSLHLCRPNSSRCQAIWFVLVLGP